MRQGLKHYFTGLACKYGHIGKRIVSSHGCHECRKEMRERKAQEKGVIKWSKTEQERKQRRSSALKKYRDGNAEKIKESQEKFKLKNPEKAREIKNAWAKKQSKEYFRLKSHKRRAIMVGKISKDIISFLKKMQRGFCASCKTKLLEKYEIDHIVPLSKGGPHTDENLQLLCPPCNRKKWAKHPIDFMQSRGFLL
jgi:5-methylcytosine-specific restriction endonuclease McrA